ncbi:peptidoglycan-binding protein [Burkholderia cepacia]|uniref:Peptidoglycan-binding protein n=1 Tax=Burkholderia cepacia TaxID=292 RepID=A0A0J5X8H5_BURCE|nr:LWXIA domain-containing protein [Burkholderia cepacia]KML63534.1 peptidoglycan-binding protein [Burkholderia cepacia]
MLSIDGMGLGLNWQRFLSQTLNPDLAPKPPQNVDGTSNDGPNNGPANPVNPAAAPPIPVQADLGTDPSKPTNAEIGSATALLQSLADQYRVAPPEITVDNDTTRAVQGVIQDAQTKYDNAQQALQGAQGVLRMTSRDPDSTPDEHKAAVDNYTKARNAADTAQRELDVTTDAGYRILYGEQAKADQYSSDPTNQNIEGPAQQQADAKLAALQKLFPDQTKANPNFVPQQGDCKTPDQVQAYDDWQSATSSATVGQAKYWADVSNANLAYTQFQSYMGDPAYKDAIDTGVGNLNDALAQLQLQVDLPDPPAADQNGNVDMNAVQANVAQAAKIANYSNAAYAASLDAQQVTTLQQKYDVDSACLIGSTPGAAKDDKAALDRATTQANTSGSYMQMLGAQLTVDDLQTQYDTAKSASDDWHTANPKSLDPHPKVDVDLGHASDALAQAKQTASLAHDGFVVAYGQTLAQQYDDAGSQIDAQLAPKVPFVLQNPTPTLSTNPPPTTTPAPSPGPSPSLSTSLPSASGTPNTSSTPAPSTTQTPSSSLSTSAPASSLSTSFPPTTLFTNPSFVLRPPGSNTSVPTTATGQTALDAKKLHVVAGALRAADGRLSNTYNDAAAKFQLANAQTQEGVLKGKLADTQKTYDDWYAHNPTPVRLRTVDGDEIPMPTPLRANPYQGDLDKARSDLQQADANINKLQLLTEMSHQQVLLDQFDASLAENLRNPQSQDDKDAYSKALDGFFRAHQGELSQSLLDQAGASTNKAATIDFGKLTDNEQRNLIGTAIGLAPDVQPSSDAGSPTAPVNDDTVRYTDKDKLDTINKVRGEILKLGGGAGTQVNILPLIYSDKTAGMVTSALFKVTDGKGNVQYVDDTSAQYDNVGDYLDNNQLASSGTLDLVTGYDGNGHAQFQQKAAHHDDWFDSALNTLTGGKVNLGMMGLGLLMEGAGVLLDATGAGAFAGAALNFTGAAMMDTAIGSSMAKSAIDIGSRWDHNQSINPFTDAGARGDWLNLVPMGAAGAAKFAGSEVFGKTITALTGSAKAARVTTAIVRGTSLATGVGAAGESFVEAGFAFADGNSKQGWEDLKSGFTNVALMGAGGVRDRVVNAAVRVTGRPVIARSAAGDSISIDGQQLQKILSGKEPPQLALGATRASLDGVDIKVAKDGTLMAGDKVLTYDNMPVRVLDGLNNKDLNNLPRGASVMLGENGELSIVKLTGKTWTEGTKIDSITETGDRLSFGSDGEIDAPSKLVAKTPTQWQDDLQQQANDNAPPADPAQNAPAADEAATRASEASNTATATTAASARNAQHTSEAQAARDENQQETRSSDSHVAAQNRRSSDLRAAEDPAVARAPGAPGASALEEPASVAPRTPVRVIDLTDAEPASRPATLDPAGVSVPRGPSVEALDYGEHTLFIVRNGDDHAAAPPDAAQPRAAGSLPADVAEPIVVIADAADAHVAPELANRWQRPVFAATPEALHADGTLRADASLTRYMPAPDAPVTGGRVVGTNAQAQHADATAGIAEADTPTPAPEAPAIRRAPPPANDDTVIVLASTKRGATDPENSAALPPQPPARAARALDGAFSAPNRILVLIKPAEQSASQAANDASDASRPTPTGDAHAEDHALPPAAHPETTEAPPDPSLAGPGLFTRLQMRFGGAPLPDAVHALAQQSDTLTQQLRMMSDAGWRVSLGKRGGGSRIDPKRRRVTIDGGLRDSGSITYTLAHEAKHAVEAIDGTLDSLDYSGRSRFTRKALEAEARAQLNAFEARYEIDLAGGGDIAAKTTLPDALQHEADRWGPSSDYAGTVERLADAFADTPVSGRRGETYQAFYDGIWDKQKRHGGAPRRMPAPRTTESAGDGGTHLPRTLDEQVQWSNEHADRVSPFPRRWFGGSAPKLTFSRNGPVSYASGEPLTLVHARTDAAGGLLDAHGRPATPVDYSIDHRHAFGPAQTGNRLVLDGGDARAAHGAWLANIWQRTIYVPDNGTVRAIGESHTDRTHRMQFGGPGTWTRYTPSPRERIDPGALAADASGLHVAGDPSRRVDPAELLGPFLGAGTAKAVFELGKRNAIGLFEAGGDKARTMLEHETRGLDQLKALGMRTVTVDGPFTYRGRIAVLYSPLAELGSIDVMNGILPKRVTRESMRQLAAMRALAERHGLSFDFEGLFDAQGNFYFSDPSVLIRHPDPAANRTPRMIDAVIDPLKRGIASGHVELAHPAISETLPDGAFVQKPSLITRIRMWFGGAPLPDAAYALAGQSSLLADQMRLLNPGHWEIVQGRAGAGSKVDAEQRRIVIDGGLRHAGTIVYVLAHEIGHAVDVATNRLDLDTRNPDAYVQSTLLAEARAQANAFAVRKQILEATGIDIAEHAVLPDAIAREADHVMPGDEAGLARLADAFGNAPTSLPGNPVYRALYRAQAEQAMRDGEAGRAGAAPRTMPSMMMWPVPDPSTFMPAAPVLTPESRAADWLDAHGKRDLKRIDGTQLADIRDLAQYTGPNAHVLIAKHLDRPADDGTHPQPDFVASLKTDAYSQPGQPEAADPGDTPSHEVRDAVYPGTRPRKRNDSKPPHEARADFDFYLSPVSLDELRQFGGAAKVEDIDTKRVWDAEPSGDVPADEVVKQIDALARAPQYKRPKAAAKAAEALPAGATIFAVDKKTGKVLGYAEPEQGGWTYHEKTSVGDASIGAQALGTAFRRRARGLPDGRRGVVFVPSSLPESAVSRYGGFEPAERALPVAEQKPPPLKLSDRVQRRIGRIQSAGKPPAGATPLAHRWVAPNLLPKSADDVHDFSGANTLHLRRVIDFGQVGPAYFIYVYGTEGALIDTLHKPDGILATRDGKLQWFDDATHFNDAGKPGIDLDKTTIGGGPDGANRHFLVTKLDPAAFDARAKPTQLEAYALKQAELDKQLKKAATESSAPFGELEKRIATELTAATTRQARLANDPASGAPAASPPAKPKKRTRGKGKNRNPNTQAVPAPAASPALPTGEPFSIKTYQPGLSSATIAEWILRFGKAKVDNWFPEHERVKAFAGRSGKPLDLGANRQVMMADSVMMKALGLPLRLARDVSSMPWHGPLSRPDHAANVLSRHAKGAMTYLSIARAADRHALQAYARAKAEIQDRIALMARGFTLRDNPDEMLALVKRYGGAMPVVSVAVDPHSLAAALGRKHDPAFIRRVRELGNLDNAQFDEANARIDIDGTGRQLELDDLDHLYKWLDAASEGGFVLRLETAPSRALVSAEDQRTLAGTNDAYHDYVRTFDALETWARRNTDKDAPHVMVTFHGWDAVLEPVPGDGHLKLVEAVLDRKELDWVHLGLSYATHGSDFIANQDLTAALARKLVEYELRAPGKLARLHGADALTRVFERVGTQTLANQHQVLFAEVERVGLANGMTPETLAQLRTKLYEGNTTALMDRARQATITYAKENYWNTAAAANRAEFRARDAGNRWLSQYGKPDTEPMQLKIAAHANASSTAFWRAVAADPKLAIDDTKPVIVNRDIAAQPSHQRGDPQKAALAQLNALRVHRPSFGKRDWMWSLGFGGTVAGASSLVALNVFNGMNMMSSDALSHANTALFVGARAGRVFGAMHQGAVQSLQSGDPRAVHDVLDRLQRSLAQQLSASVHGYNPARLEQLDLLTNETRVKASHFVEMHRQGLIGFDDAAAQIKELSADLLANMQGMVGGTSLTQLHRGNSRRLLGLVGRGSAIVGYSGTIAVGVHGLMTTPTVAGALTTASAALAATYSGLVYAVSAHRVNADKRSRVVRLIDSTSDFVGVASGVAGTIAQYDKGHYGLAATAATSTAILLGARLNTHFPNATRWVKKYPTALILVPIGIWGFTQLQSLFFGSPSSGSGSSTHKPQPTSSSSSHQPPQTGGTPTTRLAPGATATQPPGTGTTGSTAPAQPSAPPSPAAQPYIVVAGDSLWVIADAHRQSLLDAAHVSPNDQKTMTRDQQDARALNEILQLNPGMASTPNVLHVGQSINIG